MKKKPKNKYDVSGNIEAEFVDEAQQVLVNKLGVHDLTTLYIAEEEGLAKAYETLLAEVKTDTPMTSELLCHIHSRIFGEIYEWAGRWRTVQISKPGAIWPHRNILMKRCKLLSRRYYRNIPQIFLVQTKHSAQQLARYKVNS